MRVYTLRSCSSLTIIGDDVVFMLSVPLRGLRHRSCHTAPEPQPVNLRFTSDQQEKNSTGINHSNRCETIATRP